jgi:hypothetical protein
MRSHAASFISASSRGSVSFVEMFHSVSVLADVDQSSEVMSILRNVFPLLWYNLVRRRHADIDRH